MQKLTGPVQLSDPLGLLEPVPVDGCDVCASLGRQREEARRRADMSMVSDCNVEINKHPHDQQP